MGTLSRVRMDTISRCSQLCSSGSYSRGATTSQGRSGSRAAEWPTRSGRRQLPALCGYALNTPGFHKYLRFRFRPLPDQVLEGTGPNTGIIPALRAL